jgi:hypothetical protein
MVRILFGLFVLVMTWLLKEVSHYKIVVSGISFMHAKFIYLNIGVAIRYNKVET